MGLKIRETWFIDAPDHGGCHFKRPPSYSGGGAETLIVLYVFFIGPGLLNLTYSQSAGKNTRAVCMPF